MTDDLALEDFPAHASPRIRCGEYYGRDWRPAELAESAHPRNGDRRQVIRGCAPTRWVVFGPSPT